MQPFPVWLVVLCAVLGAILVWLVARTIRLATLRARARARVSVNPEAQRELASGVGALFSDKITAAEMASYGALTAGEFAWSWATIDPQLIQAADFASSSSIHSGLDFAQYIHAHYDSLSAAGKDAFADRLAGYVGEQKVALLLQQAGHSVQMAGESNQPIWDLLIDGHAANVKTVADAASVKADALAHPDVSFILPHDAHGALAGNMVPLEGFSHDSAGAEVNDGIAAAHGEHAMQGLGLHLPFITIGFAAYRNIRQVVLYDKNPWAAAKHAVIESVGRGGGLIAGGKIGGLVGSPLGPIGAVAGAVIGGIGGALFGGALAEKFKLRALKAALAEFQERLKEYGRSYSQEVKRMLEDAQAPVRRMRDAQQRLAATVQARKATWRFILWPDFLTVALDEALQASEPRIQDEQARADRVASVIRDARAGAWEKLGVLMANAPLLRSRYGANEGLLSKVTTAREAVLRERKHLNPQLDLPV